MTRKRTCETVATFVLKRLPNLSVNRRIGRCVRRAASGFKRGEAKISPVVVVVVEETNARAARSPRSVRSKSAARCAGIGGLQNLFVVSKESNDGWIRSCRSCGDHVPIDKIDVACSGLEVPIAVNRAIPAGDVTVPFVRLNAAIGLIPRDALGRNRRPQPQFHFMAAAVGRCLLDLYRSRNRLRSSPGSREDGSRITELCRLIDSKGEPWFGLDVAPQTPPFQEVFTDPEARACAAPPEPSATLTDRLFRQRESCAVRLGARFTARRPCARCVRNPSMLAATAQKANNTDEQDRVLPANELPSCAHIASLTGLDRIFES